MLDPSLRLALIGHLDQGLNPGEVAEWLQAVAPELGWGVDEIEAFQIGRGGDAADDAATRAAVRADVDEMLVTLRGQAQRLARLFDVQAVEILRSKAATHDKIVKAHIATAEQFRKHLETLRDTLPGDPSKSATVGDLLASLFAAQAAARAAQLKNGT